MYRHRLHLTVSDTDSWNQLVAIVDEMNKLSADRGWSQGKLWTQTVGRFNELILDIDYPDLATFQRENEEFFADPAAADIGRRIDALKTEPGTGYSELLEEAEAAPS